VHQDGEAYFQWLIAGSGTVERSQYVRSGIDLRMMLGWLRYTE
jgi:hypothetical protein